MNFEFSPEQRAFGHSLERALSQACPRAAVRGAITAGSGHHAPSWKVLTDLGVLGCAIPETYGGHGLSELELALAAEQIGAAVAPVPVASSIYVAALTLVREGSQEQCAMWLPRLARGEITATFHFGSGLAIESGTVRGRASPVADGDRASLLVALCADGGASSLCLVDLSRGVRRRPLDCLDASKPLTELVIDGARGEFLGERGAGEAAADRAVHRAAVLLAFEQLGGAQAALMTARDYALERRTFGRAIGSYQAVKHKLADVWVRIEIAKVHAYYAAWALANGSPDLELAAAAARASATEAFLVSAREGLHVHGGIGFTWEADCHLFYRRARALAAMLGPAVRWREEIAARLERGERASK